MLYDPERRWIPRGICRTEDEKYFFPRSTVQAGRAPTPAVQAAWDRAKQICAQCPVLAECRRDTLGEDDGVFGGLDPNQRVNRRKRLRKQARRWSPELRLEWSQELYKLRQGNVTWSSIRLMTGIPRGLAEELVLEYRQLLAEQQAPAPVVVDLPLPKAVPEKKAFPAKPGRCHGWVRNGALFADAWYRGETPDGEWLLMTHYSGRGNVHKWIRAEDVQLYRLPPVVILRYEGRPDGPNDRAPTTASAPRAPAA